MSERLNTTPDNQESFSDIKSVSPSDLYNAEYTEKLEKIEKKAEDLRRDQDDAAMDLAINGPMVTEEGFHGALITGLPEARYKSAERKAKKHYQKHEGEYMEIAQREMEADLNARQEQAERVEDAREDVEEALDGDVETKIAA